MSSTTFDRLDNNLSFSVTRYIQISILHTFSIQVPTTIYAARGRGKSRGCPKSPALSSSLKIESARFSLMRHFVTIFPQNALLNRNVSVGWACYLVDPICWFGVVVVQVGWLPIHHDYVCLPLFSCLQTVVLFIFIADVCLTRNKVKRISHRDGSFTSPSHSSKKFYVRSYWFSIFHFQGLLVYYT